MKKLRPRECGAGAERSALVALGSPLTGLRSPQRPEFPYEDATSTEA